MSMYIRVKRRKTTVFLQVEPTDTVLEVKQKLQGLIDKPPDKLRLLKGDTVLEDARKLAELRVENDDVVAMCFANEDGSGFEAVSIIEPGEEEPPEQQAQQEQQQQQAGAAAGS